jgi:hypothetical protein
MTFAGHIEGMEQAPNIQSPRAALAAARAAVLLIARDHHPPDACPGAAAMLDLTRQSLVPRTKVSIPRAGAGLQKSLPHRAFFDSRALRA